MRAKDAGAALVWGLALILSLVLVGGAGLSLCGLALAHARAGNAADLAAIAGANNSAYPCAAADRVASANATVLLDCTPTDGDVIVTVGVSAPQIARWLGHEQLVVTARAGWA